MRDYYKKSNNTKIVVYAVILALLLGVGAVVIQDIEIPTDHVSQPVEVTLEK
ncbi:MAG: hypothetical protein IKN71_06050 [Alphaproteobacteria bacterium]|jgi:hypothetical protein|nr:hypothetical protein [Alphaproteobacteria bacterium]